MNPVERMLRDETARIAGVADLKWTIREGVSTLQLTPQREGAAAFSVAWSPHEIVVSFGHDSRLELGPNDLDLLRDLVSALIAGRLVERRHGRDAGARITLADGRSIGDPAPLRRLFAGSGSTEEEIRYAPYL